MRLTPNPVSSCSGSDVNMTLSSKRPFAHQRQTWASCPDWVLTMILMNIRETFQANMQQEHIVREDPCEGFSDDWAAVTGEVQTQISSQAPTPPTPPIQSENQCNLGRRALAAPLVTNSIRKKLSPLSIAASRPDLPPHA